MKRGTYKAALLQLNTTADVTRNLSELKEAVAVAAATGARLVVLPETVDYIGTDFGQGVQERLAQMEAFFSSEAKKHNIYLHGGSVTERDANGRLYNTSLFYQPDGQLLGRYRKLHMFDVSVTNGPAYRESDQITAGEEIVLVDTAIGRIGMAICFDVRFPELFRIMAQQGADLIVLPANFTKQTGAAHWESLLRARAIENGCYLLACGQCGEKPAFTAHGHSMVVSPWGEIIAQSKDQPECITAEIDLDYLENIRRQIPVLENIRPDIYQLSSKKVHLCKETICN